MRLVELSDHPGTLLRDIQRERDVGGQRALAKHERELTKHQARLARARARRDEARARHRWWAWIRASLAVWAQRRRIPRPPVLDSGPTGQEESIAAGMAGEQLVATQLGVVLDDEWTLFRGYRNRRGEIDHLLVGPRGVYAVEVKYHNATVYINGDEWQFDKFDRWGNRVEHGRIDDRTGRSPSVQLSEPAEELERFLSSRGQLVLITKVVILNHPRSRIGGQHHATVQVATSAQHIVDLVRESRTELSHGRVTQIASLIERDHRFHEARRRRR
jgi:Nuclease-related domain